MIILSVLLLVIACQQISTYTYQTKYFEVPVDHFSFSNNNTFKLKYLINDTYWLEDGPIFFYTGNEGEIESFAENTGFMFDIAPQFNALIIFAEHRYYGESLPFGNLSFTSPNYLGYLTATQALADYVLLIDYLQKTHPTSETIENVPVVAFGGSYGGMLATWIRMKYPASVLGAIAASAPIWSFSGLIPCENFNRIVTNVYQTVLQFEDCSQPIKRSWPAIRNIIKTNDGKIWLSKQWKLCKTLKTDDDVDALINWLTEIYVNMAMVNYPYPTSFLVPLPGLPVREFCRKLSNTTKSDDKTLLIQLGTALEIYTNYTNTNKCNNINVTSPALGEAAWNFQACTEIIIPMCSTDNEMFEIASWNFTEFSENCYKQFHVKQSNPSLPILEYGGRDLSAASNIVFSNGLMDPWSSGGVLNNISSTVYSVVIPESAHHLDLRGENELDPKSVIEARKFHVRTIRKWLDNYYSSKYSKFYHLRRNTPEVIRKNEDYL